MKKLLAVFLLLLLIIGLGPWVAGSRAKAELDNLVALLNAQPDYTASWQSHRRGWLNSAGVIKVSLSTLTDLTAEQNSQYIPITIALNHGPILFTDGFRLGWFSGSAEVSIPPGNDALEYVVSKGEGSLWRSRFHMGLTGNVVTKDTSSPMEITLGGESMVLSEFNGEGKVKPFRRFEYFGALPKLELKNSDAEVTLEALEIRSSVELNSAALSQQFAPGVFSLNVMRGVGGGGSLSNFKLLNLAASMENTLFETANLGNSKLDFSFDELALDDNKIDSFNLDLIFENLSLSFLKKYSDSMRDLANADAQKNPMGFDILGIVASDLVPAGPQITISDFSFQSDKGDFEFSGEANVPPPADGLKANAFTIFQTLLITAKLKADKALTLAVLEQSVANSMANTPDSSVLLMTSSQKKAVIKEQAATQFDLLQLQGMLVLQGEAVTAEFEFKNGAALLNGNPMPLSL